MVKLIGNIYAAWRASAGPLAAFHENPDPDEPPERLLQAIWWHQRLRRDELRTVDGRRVRILHPGFWNHESGPDFRGAVIQFEQETPIVGDIEVDRQTGGWRGHHHHTNPNFRQVVLHVIWADAGPGTARAEGSGTTLPVLALARVLDAPLPELATWLGTEAAVEFPESHCGQCCAPLRQLSVERVSQLLRQAAVIRFRAKASMLQARARQAGWEQALWEGLFRALGYKQNIWPMQRLAELRPVLGRDGVTSIIEWQARLFGAAGLLPDDVPRGGTVGKAYIRRLWDVWWRRRGEFAECCLPRSLWKFSGLRPANRPERRLALAAHWLADGTLPGALETWCAQAVADRKLVSSLARVAATGSDGFWSWHWTLRTPRLARPSPLLGNTRLTDIAINVVLPWLWTRAQESRSPSLSEEIERRYFAWPPAEDNAILRLARRRLLGTESRRALDSAAAQQGLLQIVRDFCQHSNALCGDCRFPELVRGWEE